MKGFILAAGLGSRLKPWTDCHPKALVPVGGVPVLERVVDKMHRAGIEDITINVFHFADQVKDFIASKGWDIHISDERPELLETGGALLHASQWLAGEEPILVHNADILSDFDIPLLELHHSVSGADATLLISDRPTTRKLIFDSGMRLKGWHHLKENLYRPEGETIMASDREYGFGGIYIINPSLIDDMRSQGTTGKFSIVDYWLSTLREKTYMGFLPGKLNLIDIGKPESLARANEYFETDN